MIKKMKICYLNGIFGIPDLFICRHHDYAFLKKYFTFCLNQHTRYAWR